MAFTRDRKPIGELLREAGKISNEHLTIAIRHQDERKGKLASILFQMGAVDEKTVAPFLEAQFSTKYAPLTDRTIQPDAIEKVPSQVAKKYSLMPLEFADNTLTIAMSDPHDFRALDELAFMLNVKVKPLLSLDYNIKKTIAKNYNDVIFSFPDIPKITSQGSPETMELERTGSILRNSKHVPESLLDALTEILIEKNVITRTELSNKLRKKARVKG